MTLMDTDLYDEDSDTYFSSDECYCKHGRYIGTPGGPDLMCGACEGGEPDPTVNELARWVADLVERIEGQAAHFEALCPTAVDLDLMFHPRRNVTMIRYAMDDQFRQLAGWQDTLAEARRWSRHDDDDDWLRIRHYTQLRESSRG